MGEFYRRNSGYEKEARDYKERFEFKLTVGNNIICQRYFRINNFNPLSLGSFELADTIRACGALIDNELKHKTEIYESIAAPQVFKNEEEMNSYFEDEAHRANMRIGTGIVLREPEKAPNYIWSKKGVVAAVNEKFDNGEFTNAISEEDRVLYKFAFYDNGKEVCATSWEGIYPKFVRNSIDLSNKRGKLAADDDPTRLSFEQYILYKMVEGKTDLVYRIIKDICYTCSSQDNSWYTTTYQYHNGKKIVKCDNLASTKELKKELKRLEAYLNE